MHYGIIVASTCWCIQSHRYAHLLVSPSSGAHFPGVSSSSAAAPRNAAIISTGPCANAAAAHFVSLQDPTFDIETLLTIDVVFRDDCCARYLTRNKKDEDDGGECRGELHGENWGYSTLFWLLLYSLSNAGVYDLSDENLSGRPKQTTLLEVHSNIPCSNLPPW